jgi:hypothetical protein
VVFVVATLARVERIGLGDESDVEEVASRYGVGSMERCNDRRMASVCGPRIVGDRRVSEGSREARAADTAAFMDIPSWAERGGSEQRLEQAAVGKVPKSAQLPMTDRRARLSAALTSAVMNRE